MKIKIYKIKEGKKEKFLAWGQELATTYKDEVLKTLLEERVEREFVGMFEIEGKSYVVGFMLGDEMLPSSDKNELNLKHREVLRDCLELPTLVDIVYDFRSPL